MKKYLTRKTALIFAAVFLTGFAAFGAMNTFFAYTNELEFCTSCHSMKNNFEEYKDTVHYKNASGVRAVCSDCHVPKSFLPKLGAKIAAAKDVYHELAGTVDTKEKFEEHRFEMALRVWEKMKSTDSRECRSCHDFKTMDLSAQSHMARKRHARAQMQGKTCIDCHKGIAHMEPDYPDWYWKKLDAEESKADDGDDSGD